MMVGHVIKNSLQTFFLYEIMHVLFMIFSPKKLFSSVAGGNLKGWRFLS